MKDLEEEVRTMLEKEVDTIIKEPKDYEETFSYVLRAQGIEPNPEAILSFITGYLFGRVFDFYWLKHNRDLKPNESVELVELLKRRAFEIRMAFMGTRIET